MYFEGASPSTTRSRKPISSPKIITSRQAFASAVIGSPVLPSGLRNTKFRPRPGKGQASRLKPISRPLFVYRVPLS
ncbi:hypothetical protein V6Z12_A03G111400 [Gossypium hirsutum]